MCSAFSVKKKPEPSLKIVGSAPNLVEIIGRLHAIASNTDNGVSIQAFLCIVGKT